MNCYIYPQLPGMSNIILQSFRIPRGLWNDIEATVIQQDRQFLSEVARQLCLPVQEVLRRCLGTSGVSHSIPVLWASSVSNDLEACPWWDCHGDGLWRRCPRIRLSSTLPCQIHEQCTPCPLTCLNDDPHILYLPTYTPVRWKGELYWVDPTGVNSPFREDGTVEERGNFKQISINDEKVWIWIPVGIKENNHKTE
jgi:hypothetical protein